MDISEFLSFSTVYFRWALAFIFLLASKSKIQDLKDFVATIGLSRFLPVQFSNSLAYIIVFAEFCIGISLILGFFTRLSLIIATFLLILFTAFIVANWIRGNIFDCNCFGPYFREKIGGKALLRNGIFIVMCLVGLQLYDGYLSVDSIWLYKNIYPNYPLEHFILFTFIVLALIISTLFAREIMQNFIRLETK